MTYNQAEMVAIASVLLVGVIQFLRCRRDFSQVFYETAFLVAALVGAIRIAEPLRRSSNLPMLLCFVTPLVVFAMGALILATLLNKVFEFDLGRAGWLFGLVLALICGVLAGHAVLRAIVEAYGPRRPEFAEAIMRSWLASQLYHYPALKNLLGSLSRSRPD
ncbi:MAG: hypothetical protein ABIK86_01195 [candidate division WOR-3 bacterium]